MCIEGLSRLLAERGVRSPFRLDGAFKLSSEPEDPAEPLTDAELERLLERPPTDGSE